MALFSIPTLLKLGDACHHLADIQDKRILIICDSFLAESDNLKLIRRVLKAKNQVEIFSKVKPDPTAADVAVGFACVQACQPDVLIAYGGGSAIDLAKAVSHTHSSFGHEKLQLIAIPTTSGTGSEVTSATVVSIPETQQKIPLFDASLSPDIAILDAKQTYTVPPRVTSATGIDVLTHALEALVATNATDFSDAFAEKAIMLVDKHLATAYAEPTNERARAAMANASCLAGLAFNHAGLGLAHAIAHQIGATMHIPHGEANGAVLIPVIKFNSKHPKARAAYARVAHSLGLSSPADSEQQCVDQLIAAIELLYKRLSFNPSEVLSHEKKADYFATMAPAVLKDITLTTNPIQPTEHCVQTLLASL